jgi:sulfate permease, SulP family
VGINLKRVSWQQLRGDLSGALVSSLVTLAPMMAMGVIAFAPLGHAYVSLGIVASLAPAVVLTVGYALFGGSSNLLAGPRAAVCLVFAATTGSFLAMDPIYASGADREAAALTFALIATMAAGLLLIVFGLCRLGEVIKYVPFPVTAGFLNSAAALIILSQVHVIFQEPAGTSILDVWQYVDGHTAARFVLALITVVSCFVIPKFVPRVSGLLAGGAVGVAAYHAALALGLGLDLGATMPAIPAISLDPRPLGDFFEFVASGFEAAAGSAGGVSFNGVLIDGNTLPQILAVLVPAAVSIALLQSLDGLFAAVALEDLTQNRFDAGRDLVVLGCGSILCGSFGFLSGTGSFTRTLPAYRAGARTAWSGLATSVITLLAIVIFAPFIAYIPNVVVAGVLFVLAIGIVDRWTLDLLKNLRANGFATERAVVADLAIVALVVGTAIAFGLVEAVGMGVMVAIANFVLSIGRSPVRRAYRGDAVSSFLQRGDFSAALLNEYGDRLAVLELEGPFFFGSAGRVERDVDQLAEAGVDHVILDLKRVNAIDSTGARTLFRLARRLERRGKTLSVSYVMAPARDPQKANGEGTPLLQHSAPHENWIKLSEFGAMDSIGRHHFFPDTDTAMRHCEMLLVDAIAKDGKTPVAAWPTMTGLLDELSDEETRVLRSFAEEIRHEAGETIFEQGDPGDALYVLLDGMVDAIVRQEPGGRGIRVNSMSSGAVFGEMAILDPQPRSATIVAVEDTRCLRIGARALETLNAQHPALGLRLMKYMCLLFTTRLRLANLAIIELET